MSQRIPIYIPTFISDATYNPNRVLPRLYFFNGMVECEAYYIESGSLVNSGQTKETTQFPYFDHYNVVSGQFPTTGSRSLLFNNEAPVYGQQPSETLFTEYWSNYVELLYNPKTRLITAKAIIPLADYFDMELNDVINWRGNYYHLRAINDYNLKTGECGIQLLGPIIADTLDGYTPPPIESASVKIHLKEYNESPTAFFDLNVFANGESFFFSGDFTQSVSPNTSDVDMEIAQQSISQNWGPYKTGSATLTIKENNTTIYDSTTTYFSGSAQQTISAPVNFRSGRTYIISASNQPIASPSTTTTTSTTTVPPVRLDWSFNESIADGQMILYINGNAVENRFSNSSGTYYLNVGDTIACDVSCAGCSSPNSYANAYTLSDRVVLVDADCSNGGTAGITTSTYTVVSGDIGNDISLSAYAACDVACV